MIIIIIGMVWYSRVYRPTRHSRAYIGHFGDEIIIINALTKVTLSQRTVAGTLNNNNNRTTIVSAVSLDSHMTTSRTRLRFACDLWRFTNVL